jgi:endonuclease/exonuclease/phosphatase family metal-dependent hydrolase
MSTIRIATFNAENLFMRYNFNKKADIRSFKEEGGHINMLKFVLKNSKPIGKGQVRNTAKVISANDPDVVGLQEIENMETIKQFNRIYLKHAYPYAMLIDGNDRRQIDVAILSKYPIENVKTHQFDKDSSGNPIFSRDCLECDINIDDRKVLTLFVNHFKSQYRDNPVKRRKQAERVSEIIKQRYGDDLNGDFVVLGDFNQSPDSETLQPLLSVNGLENIVQTRIADNSEKWTEEFKGKPSQLDYILLSPSLSERSQNEMPYLERRGLSNLVKSYKGPRFPGVGPAGTEASDHCALFMNIEI